MLLVTSVLILVIICTFSSSSSQVSAQINILGANFPFQPLHLPFPLPLPAQEPVQERSQHYDDTLNIISARGFKGEMYTFENNNYTMSLYRIINPLANLATLNKYPVVYFHGVLFNSANMISNSNFSRPRKPIVGDMSVLHNIGLNTYEDDASLPFMLSNNNFDVWLADARGTNEWLVKADLPKFHFSTNEYWNFNVDDEALIDLPKIIDYVLYQTGAQKVVYISYSESTSFMLMLLCAQPRFADKVAVFVAMAPIAYLTHLQGLSLALIVSELMPNSIHLAAIPEPIRIATDFAIANLCGSQSLNTLTCALLLNSIGGPGTTIYSPQFFQKFYKPTSLTAFKQFVQLFNQRRFGRFDYGKDMNLVVYGQEFPPNYNLGDIISDRMIFARGQHDYLSTPQDQETLVKSLNVKLYGDIIVPQYNHFDFVFGIDLIRRINEPVVRLIYEILKTKEYPFIRDQNMPFNSPLAYKPVRVLEPNNGAITWNSIIPDKSSFNQEYVQHLIKTPINLISDLTYGLQI